MAFLPYAGLLIVYGNVAAYVAGSALAPGPAGVLLGAALVVAVFAYARADGLSLGQLGLRRERLGLGVAVGSALALVGVAAAMILLRYPPLVAGPVTYAPLAAMSTPDLAVRIALTMPLDTIIPEELAFRGLLLAQLLRRYRVRAAVVVSALAFAGWHAVIVTTTIAQTSLAGDRLFAGLGLVGAFLAVFGGGVSFAALRVTTGSLAAPIAAHWVFNSALLVGLSALGR